MIFPTFKKKNWCKKNFWGVSNYYFFFLKTLLYHFISHFMLFSTLKKNCNIEKCPFTYWLNGRWFLQIVDRAVGIYIQYNSLFPCSDFFKCGGGLGGGVIFFLHFMLFPTFLEKINSGNKKIFFCLEKQ